MNTLLSNNIFYRVYSSMTCTGICFNLVICYFFIALKCYLLHVGYNTIDVYPLTIIIVPFIFVSAINIITFSLYHKFKDSSTTDFSEFCVQRIIFLFYFVLSLVCLDALCLYLFESYIFYNHYSMFIYSICSNNGMLT